MLMKDPKKGMAAMIIAKMAPKPKEGEAPMNEEGAMPDNEIGLKSAAEELMNAFEQKNVDGIVTALKSFMEMCDEQEPEYSSEEEKPE
jgi:hypothetical protein